MDGLPKIDWDELVRRMLDDFDQVTLCEADGEQYLPSAGVLIVGNPGFTERIREPLAFIPGSGRGWCPLH
jgi:hypothetical protein